MRAVSVPQFDRPSGPDARLVGESRPVARKRPKARVGHEYDEVVDGYVPDALANAEAFDLVCYNDVLEHVVDPGTCSALPATG